MESSPRISIAMCTYNGAQHVEEQLNSFAAQERLPDELVVCDDASDDHTFELVERFAKSAPFAVRAERNGTRLGFVQNFGKAVSMTTGDLILPSDQDDVWLRSKLAKFDLAIKSEPRAGMIICDAMLVDQHLQSMGRTWWERQRFGNAARRRAERDGGFAMMLRNPAWIAAGATMAIPARYKDRVLPIPAGWTHDAWMATVTSAFGPVVFINESLNLYRQHQAQTYGASADFSSQAALGKNRGATTDHFEATAERYRVLRTHLQGYAADLRSSAHLQLVEGKIQHWLTRGKMRASPLPARMGLILKELGVGGYGRFSQSWKSMALDVVSCFQSPGRR